MIFGATFLNKRISGSLRLDAWGARRDGKVKEMLAGTWKPLAKSLKVASETLTVADWSERVTSEHMFA